MFIRWETYSRLIRDSIKDLPGSFAYVIYTRPKLSRSALVKNVELEPGVRREKLGNFLQPLRQCGRRQQCIVAFTQLVIIHIQAEREHVNGDGVRKSGSHILRLGLFVHSPGAAGQGLLAKLKGVKAGFTAGVAGSLRPYQVGKFIGDSGVLHKGVSHIDVKLKGNGEPLIQQPRGNKHALRIARIDVAMADGSLRRRAVKAFGNQRLVAFADGERDKAKSLALQSGST